MGSKIGPIKIAAKRIGISVELYSKNIEKGLKWCTKGKHWVKREEFSIDKSRGDKLCSRCYDCNSTTKKYPNKRQRERKKAIGLNWCRICKQWIKKENVRSGICNKCIRAEDKKRYANNADYRAERRQHAHSRKRKIKPVPVNAQKILSEVTNSTCVYCGNKAEAWDHIIPVIKGGKTEPGNIVPVCTSCNSSKKDNSVLDWLDKKNIEPNTEFLSKIQFLVMQDAFNLNKL